MNRYTQLPSPKHQLQNNTDPFKYCLVVRQQPKKARLCSFKEKVDRRPLDPPPVVQLYHSETMNFSDYHNSPNFFVHTTLVNPHDHSSIQCANGNSTTAGSVVQSLHKLRDTNNAEAAFFIFADISIRIEGHFKLKFTLYIIDRMEVQRICSVFTDVFQVYSPKTFPGMSESTDLTRAFSDQGVRIRVRKEPRANTTNQQMKRRRGMDQQESPSSLSATSNDDFSSPPTSLTISNAMSMQNLLISAEEEEPSVSSLFPCRSMLPLPVPRLSSSPPQFSNETKAYHYSTHALEQMQLPSLIRPSSPTGSLPHASAHVYHGYYEKSENSSS